MTTLVRTSPDDQLFQTLVLQLDKELWSRYADEQAQFDVHNKIDQSAKVVVALHEDKPVGCGCFRPMKEVKAIEIKRMYVQPQARGLGIAKQILTELERWAKEEAYTKAMLETGIKQPEAIALYQKCGYTHIENYGYYKDMPGSVCMGKELQ